MNERLPRLKKSLMGLTVFEFEGMQTKKPECIRVDFITGVICTSVHDAVTSTCLGEEMGVLKCGAGPDPMLYTGHSYEEVMEVLYPEETHGF